MESKLRYYNNITIDIPDRQIHQVIIICEDTKVDDLGGGPLEVFDSISLFETRQN